MECRYSAPTCPRARLRYGYNSCCSRGTSSEARPNCRSLLPMSLTCFSLATVIRDAGAVYRATRELTSAGQDRRRTGDLDFQLHVLARHHFSQMERGLKPAGTDWGRYYSKPYRTAALTPKNTASVFVDLLRNHGGGGAPVLEICWAKRAVLLPDSRGIWAARSGFSC